MSQSPIELAEQVLAQTVDCIEVIRIHQFASDEEAHDDAAQERLLFEFEQSFATARAQLEQKFGRPSTHDKCEASIYPVCGVIRGATWKLDKDILYLVAAHEDRECPFLLVLGTKSQVSAII